jgi:DUF971 family protein
MGLLDRISFKKHDAAPPESIHVQEDSSVRIKWPDGPEATIPAVRLRDFCPCAGCVEEGTGRKLLNPATIPSNIHPDRIEAVGSYAVKIEWSDGHNTGIYTWDVLRRASGLGG